MSHIKELVYTLPESVVIDAFRGVSFDPEKRAAMVQTNYNQMLNKAKAEMTAEEFEYFQPRYKSKYIALLSAEGRCISSMITGPSNFPVERNRKRLDTANKRRGELLDFEKRAFTRSANKRNPRAISSDDPEAIQKLTEKLVGLQREHAQAKEINQIIHGKPRNVLTLPKYRRLRHLPLKQQTIRKLFESDFAGRLGFPGFHLTNLNANIKRVQDRITQLAHEAQRPEAKTITGNGYTLEECPDDNRIRFYFDKKPDDASRELLKCYGWRWSPKNSAWQRQLTENARRSAAYCSEAFNREGV